jgi:hypothetical protein
MELIGGLQLPLISGRPRKVLGLARPQKLKVVRIRSSFDDGAKSSESETSSNQAPISSNSSDAPTAVESPPAPSTSNPFTKGKISRIASYAKQVGESRNSGPSSVAQKVAAPVKKPAAAKPAAVGQLSANAAAQLKVSRQPSVFKVPTKPTEGKPTSPFSQQPTSSKPTAPKNPFVKTPFSPENWEQAGARPAGSGKRVLDAFKQGEKEGITTKFGQPVVPSNIFDEVRRTPEEIAADSFKFEINPGQILLAGSFLIVIAVMFGTVFLVWKVGAIHYNEY